MPYYCYIVANRRNGTLYIGNTDDLTRRIGEHKNKTRQGFAAKYGCDLLVWFEKFGSREDAFACERRMKEWRRSWKLRLIEEKNPEWEDLYWDACGLHRPGDPYRIVGLLPLSDGDGAASDGG